MATNTAQYTTIIGQYQLWKNTTRWLASKSFINFAYIIKFWEIKLIFLVFIVYNIYWIKFKYLLNQYNQED